jgi:nucleotide-binding universal stress UspA family protein
VDRGTIVAGWDGSTVAESALRWALEEGRRRGAAVEVVLAWDLLTQPGPFEAHFDQSTAERRVAEAVRRVAPPGTDLSLVRTRAELGQGAGVLLAACEHADLVVVGRTGTGAVAAAMLGSVSHALLRHARCPVVIVPS